jgi:hypothetical protein
MKEELSRTGFVIFGGCMNILQVSKVKVVDTPTVDTRLVLNWTPSSTKCSTSHWLPQSAPQLPLVTFETLCWNWKHVLSNLGSLTGCYSRFFSCQRRVAVRFGCAYLSCDVFWGSGGILDRLDSYIFTGALVHSFVKIGLPLFGV